MRIPERLSVDTDDGVVAASVPFHSLRFRSDGRSDDDVIADRPHTRCAEFIGVDIDQRPEMHEDEGVDLILVELLLRFDGDLVREIISWDVEHAGDGGLPAVAGIKIALGLSSEIHVVRFTRAVNRAVMKVYAHEKLFYRIREISKRLRNIADDLDTLGQIVQNDMDVAKEDVDEFSVRIHHLQQRLNDVGGIVADELADWWVAVKLHIKRGQR